MDFNNIQIFNKKSTIFYKLFTSGNSSTYKKKMFIKQFFIDTFYNQKIKARLEHLQASYETKSEFIVTSH